MSRRKIIVTDHALNAFRRIIHNLKKVSLIGGEDTRSAVVQGIRRIGVSPHTHSVKLDVGRTPGEYRISKVWDYQILYKVDETRIIILDILLKS